MRQYKDIREEERKIAEKETEEREEKERKRKLEREKCERLKAKEAVREWKHNKIQVQNLQRIELEEELRELAQKRKEKELMASCKAFRSQTKNGEYFYSNCKYISARQASKITASHLS